MADNSLTFMEDMDSSESASGFTEQERQEIQASIDQITEESRVAPPDDAFELEDTPRGITLPITVFGAVIVVVGASLLWMSRSFLQDELTIQSAAGEYTSIEGRLIRELREESREEIGEKEAEIEAIRLQLVVLEDEQTTLAVTFDDRIAEYEARIRRELEREIAAERSRLIAQGIGNEEIERLMDTFEAEREAFYRRQLELFRGELEAEQDALRANINALRSQYRGQIQDLETERDTLLVQSRQREDALRAQLEARTRAAEDTGATAAEIEAARSELAELARAAEEQRAVETQIVGQFERIRGALAQNDTAAALDQVAALSDFLNTDRVIAVGSVAARRESDLFVLAQLRRMIEARIEAEVQSRRQQEEDLTLLEELAVLDRLRGLAQQLETDEAAEAQLQVATEALGALGRLGEVQGSFNVALADLATFGRDQEAAVSAAEADLEAALQREEELREAAELREEALQAAALEREAELQEASALREEELRSAALERERELQSALDELQRNLTTTREQRVIATREQRGREAQALAVEADLEAALQREEELRKAAELREEALQNDLDELQRNLTAMREQRDLLSDQSEADEASLRRQIAELTVAQRRLTAAQQRYDRYRSSVQAARANRSDTTDLVIRQELGEFFRSSAIAGLFGQLGSDVNAMFGAVATAESDAALADAADVVGTIMQQPTKQARLRLLGFEREAAEDNPSLLTILDALETMISAAE